MKFDVIADWTLNKYCNFSCPYCYVSMEDRRQVTYKGNDAQRIINSFNSSGKILLIHMSGGEPFFHRHFIDLCKGLTERHYISINTNLSNQIVYSFCEEIDPTRVSFVHCSLHITERDNQMVLSDFIDKVNALERAGFLVYVTQVMWPPVVGEFKQLFDFFQTKGILIRPKVFRGNYEGRDYPEHYTREEKDTILTFMKLCDDADRQSDKTKGHINPDLDRLWLDGYVSFKGMPCSAGSKFVKIDFDGTIRRCQSDQTNLGNIYQGEFKLFENAHLCRAKICRCPYYGFMFASGKHKIVRSRLPLFIQRMLKRE
ncbi:MAG: radical protein [Deltaproteobacteria bacterium]|jgi:MoaA/NifB/PqqE/SkfB family radical SAM enzyme|nr:radical protein [Deltaproteobacteria bacterium]